MNRRTVLGWTGSAALISTCRQLKSTPIRSLLLILPGRRQYSNPKFGAEAYVARTRLIVCSQSAGRLRKVARREVVARPAGNSHEEVVSDETHVVIMRQP